MMRSLLSLPRLMKNEEGVTAIEPTFPGFRGD